MPFLKIAAIDNGLAFPFKHPDSWRAYPFGWSLLPAARVPFSKETKEKFLSMLVDHDWCAQLVQELRKVATNDDDFNEGQFLRQMGVIRGQVGILPAIIIFIRGSHIFHLLALQSPGRPHEGKIPRRPAEHARPLDQAC